MRDRRSRAEIEAALSRLRAVLEALPAEERIAEIRRLDERLELVDPRGRDDEEPSGRPWWADVWPGPRVAR